MSSTSTGWEGYTTGAQFAISFAYKIAKQNGDLQINRRHILAGILQTLDEYPQHSETYLLASAFTLSGLKREELAMYVNSAIEKIGEPLEEEVDVTYCDEVNVAGQKINEEMKRDGDISIGLCHMFLGLIAPQKDSPLDEVLAPLNLNPDRVRTHLQSLKKRPGKHQSTTNNGNARLTKKMEKTLDAAQSIMRSTFCGRISTLHLLLGVLEDRDSRACEILQLAEVDLDEFKTKIRQAIGNNNEMATAQKRYSKDAQRALYRAHLAANASYSRYVGTEHLLLAVLPQRVPIKQFLIEKRQFGDVEEYRHIWDVYDINKIRDSIERDLAVSEKQKAQQQVAQSWTFVQQMRGMFGFRDGQSFWIPIVEFYLPFFGTCGIVYLARYATADSLFFFLGSASLILVTSGIFAAAMQFGKNKSLKARTLRIFVFALLGFFLGLFSLVSR